ncbi:3-methyl-2-oxobutanoate hydroxymethyltransferase [Streptomyces sp. DSM 41982]|uniref:3-methyl-2-oxobutanoate hydroxymethyltransferase n=2 Tax=Streptomyces TaxID=1883 RepID=A0ABD5E1Z3_9ACTN|nr:3-methyl-2-oxobutanoate hydroxymethyltransferase [Streptomyces sp. DSM 41982]MDT0415465.1 3-methyl-2-oxobutanoate hydroxymethyltransferase [Streptomyces sp. DSM 41982]
MSVPIQPVPVPAGPGPGLSACARATAPGEERFRVQTPIRPARRARVIALDPRAEGVAARLAERPWAAARFFALTPGADSAPPPALRELGGAPVSLDSVLSGTDVTVVLASEDTGHRAAARIGRTCFERGITTAGVVLGDGFEADEAVAALRPYARVLLLSADEDDARELLTALRA